MSSATYKIDGLKALQKQAPFSLLAPDQLNFLFEYSKIVKYPIGETIVSLINFLNEYILLLVVKFVIFMLLLNIITPEL